MIWSLATCITMYPLDKVNTLSLQRTPAKARMDETPRADTGNSACRIRPYPSWYSTVSNRQSILYFFLCVTLFDKIWNLIPLHEKRGSLPTRDSFFGPP